MSTPTHIRNATLILAVIAASSASAVTPSFVTAPGARTLTAGTNSDQAMSANRTVTWTVTQVPESRGVCQTRLTPFTAPIGVHVTVSQGTSSTLRWLGATNDAGVGVNCLRVQICPVPFDPRLDTCVSQVARYTVNADGSELIRPFHRYTAIEQGDVDTVIAFEPTNATVSPTATASDLLTVTGCPSSSADCSGSTVPSWVEFTHDTNSLQFEMRPPFGSAGDWTFLANSGGATRSFQLRVLGTEFVRINKRAQAVALPGVPFTELDRHHIELEPFNDDPSTAPYFDRGFMAGDIDPIGDVDHFAFTTGGDEFHKFRVSSRNVNGCNFDGRLSVHELLADGSLGPTIVEDDISGPGACPETGRVLYDAGKTYVVRMREDGDNAVGHQYFIEHDFWIEDAEESDGIDSEVLLQPGMYGRVTNSALINGDDNDYARFQVMAGEAVRLEVSDGDGGCPDTLQLRLFEFDGFSTLTLFAFDTSSSPSGCPLISFTAAQANTFVVEVRHLGTIPPFGLNNSDNYFLDYERDSNPSNVVTWKDMAGWNANQAVAGGTCAGAAGLFLGDLANNGDFFGAYDADALSPICNGDPDSSVAVDGQGVCRERDQTFGESFSWTYEPTKHGPRLSTTSTSAQQRMVVVHGGSVEDGTAGSTPSVFGTVAGTTGNDFYYDPWGECDVQTYPNVGTCKVSFAGLDPPSSQAAPTCIINNAFPEGSRVSFQMTRWNQSTSVSIARCASLLDTNCVATVPAGTAYNSVTDEFTWDIPFNATGSTTTFFFRLRATGTGVSAADYYFQIPVSNAASSTGDDVGFRDLREQKPLAFMAEDKRHTMMSYFGIDTGTDNQSQSRHYSNMDQFIYATNVTKGRSVPRNGRIGMHPAFSHGRIGDPKGDSTFEMTFKNFGSVTSRSRTAEVYLKPAFADESGQLTASAPTGSDTPFATTSVPALSAGLTSTATFTLSPEQALPTIGYEPHVGGLNALFIKLTGTDTNSANNLAGPFFVGPAVRLPTHTACQGGLFDQPGFAGTVCLGKDVTGAMVVTPEAPATGDTVTVNVQASFAGGSAWTNSSVVRFYRNQQSAPTSSTANSGQKSFPNNPDPDLVYGYTFTFTADKPNNATNTIPLRAFLDATNNVTEDGDGETNNQLPSFNSPFLLEIANTAPVFNSAAVTTATEDTTYSYQVQISDDDDVDFSRLSLTVDGPTGLDFTGAIATCASQTDRKCRTLQWVPDDDDAVVGVHPVTVFACDGDPVAGGAGDCTEQSFVINVTRVNDAPEWVTSSFDSTATEDSLHTQDLVAFDEEGDALTFSLPVRPTGMIITPLSATTARITWTPDDSGVGTKAVTARVAETGNAANRDDTSWAITVSNVNDAPTLGAPAEVAGTDTDSDASALTGAEGNVYAAQLAISDVDNSVAGQSQTFTCTKLAPTPSWLSVTRVGTTCRVTGTPGNADTGSHTVNVRVTDNGTPALSGDLSYTVTVADIVNDAPVFAAVGAQTVDQGVELVVIVAVSDDDLSSPGFAEDLSFSQTAGPSGPSLQDNGDSVTLRWTPGAGDVGGTSITLRVEDTRGGVDTVTFAVTVKNVNDAPILAVPADDTVAEGGSYSDTLEAFDADVPLGDVLTFSVVSGAPPGFALNGSTGVMSLTTINDAQVGVHEITVRVTDNDGETDDAVFTLTITNVEEDPTLTAIPNLSTNEDALFTRTAVANDPDPGASITFSLDTAPAGMTINASTGAISWTPVDADVGVHSVVVRATDDTARFDTEDFSLTVTNTNDAPAFTSVPVTVATEESPYTYTATATDDDLDSGDTLTFSAVTLPSWLNFNTATRVLSGTPDDADVGSHSVTLRVSDGTVNVDQSFTVTVAPINDAPTLDTIGPFSTGGAPIAFVVDEGQTLSFSVVGSDVDDVVGLTYTHSVILDSVVDATTNATSGAFTFTPTFDEAGEYTFEFSITDPDGAFDTEIVTITVNDVNRRPDFDSSPITVATEDALYTYDVDATDPDGDAVTFALAGTPPAGMVINSSTGVITWTPRNAQVGGNAVSVRATDEHGLSRTQAFTVTVANTNDAPVFTSTAITTATEESPYSYTATTSDDDGDTVTLAATTLPSWLSFNASTGLLSGTPDDPDVGSHTVVLRATDGNGGSTNQSFTVVVSAINDAPEIVAPTPTGPLAASEGALVSFTITADDPDGPSQAFSVLGLPAGAVVDAASGAFTWTPGFDQAGTFNLTLQVSDGSLSASRALTINVANTDRAPVATAPTTASTDEGVTVSFTVNGSDADGDTVSLSMQSAPAGATFNASTGAFSWTPTFIDDGDHDVVFRATAGGLFGEATTTIAVAHVNQAPTLGAPSSTSATQDAAFVATLDAVDIDLGTAPSTETLSFALDVGPTGMTIEDVDGDTARLRFTPNSAQVGDHAVTVRVTDAAGLEDTSSFVVGVANVNDAPVITSTATITGRQGDLYNYTLLANDADLGLGDTLTFSAPTLPAWLSFDPASGVLSGIPSNDDALVGTHAVVLSVRDTAGLTDTQSFTITVSNVNDAPSIDAVGNQTTAENVELAFTVVARDIDGTVPTLAIVGLPSGATFTTSTVGSTTEGSFVWTPGNDDAGSFPVSFTASDGSLTTVEAITITVGDVNRPPELAAIGNRTVAENALLSFAVSATDEDGDTVGITAIGGVSGGLDPFSRGASFAAGTFSWTPGFNDAGTFTARFTANDGNGGTDVETITITVTNTNRAPVFSAPPTPTGTVAAAENSALSFTVAATDADGDSLTLSAAPLATGATFNTSTGVFSWTPNFNQAGSFPLTLTATDGTSPTTRAITIVVANTDRAPTITAPSSRSVAEGQLLSFAVTGADADGDTVSLRLVSGPSGSTFTGTGASRTFSFTPGFDAQGSASAVFEVSANGVTATTTTTITITNVNRTPTLGAPSSTNATQGVAYVATLTAADDDIGSGVVETLSFTKVAGPAAMTVEKSGATEATVRFTPGPGDVNPPTQGVTIRVTDSSGATADRSYTLTIANVNDAPALAAIGNATVAEGATFAVTATASDADLDAGLADPHTFSLTTAPTGMVITPGSGAISWTTGDTDPGVHPVTVRVVDAAGASDTESFTVTVTNVDDAPVFTSTPVTTATQDVVYSAVVAANDADEFIGDTVTLSAPTLPAWLSFAPGTGVLSGTPSNDDVGNHDVEIAATDSDGTQTLQAFTIVVANVNDAPVFVSIAPQTTAEGGTVRFDVSASDPDGDGVSVTFSSTDLPPEATFDGTSFVWETGFDDEGTFTATFTADDGTTTSTLDVTITVGSVNRAPVLSAIGARSVAEGASLSFLLDAIDADGDVLAFSATTLSGTDPFTRGATLTGATFSWAPGFADAGIVVVRFTASDGTLSDSEDVTITVTEVNRAPRFTATPPSSTNEDAPFTFAASAVDDDGDTLSFTLQAGPAGMSINASNGVLSWLPTNDDVGDASVSVRVQDGRGGSATLSFTLTVVNTPDAPFFTSTPVTAASEEQLYSVAVAADDVDAGDIVTLRATVLPSWLSFSAGVLSGTPDDPEIGSHPVTIVAEDGSGLTATQAFSIVVAARNDAPVFGAPTPSGTLVVNEDAVLTFTVAADDPDGPSLSFRATGLPTGATLNAVTGVFTWRPGFNDAGIRNITIIADDSLAVASRQLTIDVRNTDRPPTITAPATATISEASELLITISGDDPDGDAVTLALVSGPNGSTFDAATRRFRWTPGFDDAGAHSATFSATANGRSTQATTAIAVSDTNRAPRVTSTPPTTATEDVPLVYAITGVDDDGDPISLFLQTGTANSSLVGNELRWTPTGAQAGLRAFVVRLSDGRGGVTDHAFEIDVQPVNDAPFITSTPVLNATEDQQYSYDVNASDEEAGPLTFSLTVAPSTMRIDAETGVITWVPNNADVGDHPVVVRVTDSGNASDEQSLSVRVTNVNDAPVIAVNPAPPSAVAEGALFSWVPAVSDVDVGDVVTLSLVLGPTGMAFVGGELRWTPDNDDVGFHTVRVRATDVAGASVQREFTVEVFNLNDDPFFVSAPINATVAEEGVFVATVLADDIDAGDELIYTLIGAPARATIGVASGQLVFTPDDAEVGSHTFTVRVEDLAGAFVEQQVRIVVTPVNDAPVLDPIANQQVDAGDTLVVTLNATDPDGPTLTFRLVAGPTGAAVTGTTLRFTPTPDQAGLHDITIAVSDGSAEDTETFTVVVGQGDLPPTLTIPADATVDEGRQITVLVSATPPPGQEADPITLGVQNLPAGAEFEPGPGAFSWVPGFDDAGIYAVRFTATNSAGTSSKVWNLTVRDINRSPTITTGILSPALEGDSYVGVFDAIDPDGDSLAFTLVRGVGNLAVNPTTGAITFVPVFADVGLQSVRVRVQDGRGGIDERDFELQVVARDDDADGLPDTWEVENGTDPTRDDADEDPDNDGLTNLEEFLAGKDPFVSNAPTSPLLVSPSADERVRTARPTLLASSSTDPDGDELTYEVSVALASDPGVPVFFVAGVVASGDDVLVTISDDLIEGERYVWRVFASDGEGLSPPGETRAFIVDAVNEAPPAPNLIAPADGSTVATSTPTLRSAPVVDPDGDDVVYVFRLRESASGSVAIQSPPISAAAGEVRFTVDTTLPSGSVWFWEVIATDSRGLSGAPSTQSRFTVDLENLPPATPTIITPAIDEVVQVVPVALVVSQVIDPEGLGVTYDFELSPDETFPIATTVRLSNSTPVGGEVRVDVGALADGAYFWRVTATDGVTSSDSVTGRFIVDAVDDPPSVPAPVDPPNNSLVTITNVTLSASAAVDPDPPATNVELRYTFELSDGDGDAVIDSVEDVTDDDDDGVVHATFTGLIPGDRYSWRVRAVEADGVSSDFSTRFAFRVELQNARPAAPALLAPDDGATVTTTTPTFRFAAAIDPDGDAVVHDLELLQGATLLQRVTDLAASGGIVEFTTTNPLPAGTITWRARGRDPVGGGPFAERSLTVAPVDEPDAGPIDEPDAGPIDEPDAGPIDEPDAGPIEQPDAGPVGPDAGTPGGPDDRVVVDLDGPAPVLAPGCDCAADGPGDPVGAAMIGGLMAGLAGWRRRRRGRAER